MYENHLDVTLIPKWAANAAGYIPAMILLLVSGSSVLRYFYSKLRTSLTPKFRGIMVNHHRKKMTSFQGEEFQSLEIDSIRISVVRLRSRPDDRIALLVACPIGSLQVCGRGSLHDVSGCSHHRDCRCITCHGRTWNMHRYIWQISQRPQPRSTPHGSKR